MQADTLGDPFPRPLKLGHCDLFSGFYGPKFTFPMYFNGRKIALSNKEYEDCVQTD